MMTIAEIMKELELCTGRFPMEAMKAAVEQREAVTPELLRVLETVAEDPVAFARREDYMAHVFALFLLAQFREKRAYAHIIKMFSAPGETTYDLAGDIVGGDLSRILASVYDGDPAPLHGLIENQEADEYVRSSTIEALLMLERSGQMSREVVVAYLRSLFHGKLERQHSYVWDGLVCAVADMPAPELLEEMRQAYADSMVDPYVADLEGIERDLAAGEPLGRKKNPLITDAITELEWWASFKPDEQPVGKVPALFDPLPLEPPLSLPPVPEPVSYAPPTPFVRPPKIGRNDPCPCGGGRKYKKCCGKG
jgi:hypothetical protein